MVNADKNWKCHWVTASHTCPVLPNGLPLIRHGVRGQAGYGMTQKEGVHQPYITAPIVSQAARTDWHEKMHRQLSGGWQAASDPE